jgi:DNA-binding transcriptional ArsR family regulator
MSAKDYPMPPTGDIRLAEVLRALSDPGRVHMLVVLADGELHPCSIDEFELDIQKSTLSHHFKTLREAGITETIVDGRNRGVRLRRADLEERFPGLIASLTSDQAVADLTGVSMEKQ